MNLGFSGGVTASYSGTASMNRGYGVPYPSPFFDVAKTYLPRSVKDLHKWCRFYFFTNPIIHAAIVKLAQYPVTRLTYDTKDDAKLKRARKLESDLRIREFEVGVGLDYFTYGISAVSVSYPLEKYLVCKKCKHPHRLKTSKSRYKWRNYKFELDCRNCPNVDYAIERDTYIKDAARIRLVRWNIENIDVEYNEITGDQRILYKVPNYIANKVRMGDTKTLLTLPTEFIDAVRKSKPLEFADNNIFVLRRATLSQKDMGWGLPLLFPVLKSAFHMSVMEKAQEVILNEHIVPMRMMFPGPSSTPGGRAADTNLLQFRNTVAAEIAKWKQDKNYIPILPMNVGFQQFGGQAKMLSLTQELRMKAEFILAGMTVPQEFVFGGLTWSGSNTSMKSLQNQLDGFNLQRHPMVTDFILHNIYRFMEWEPIQTQFAPFKMADDLQRSMFYLQLNQAKKVSDQRLLAEVGEDYNLENIRKNDESAVNKGQMKLDESFKSDIQGLTLLKGSKYQARAQIEAQKMQAEAQAEQQQQQQAKQQQQPGMESDLEAGKGGAPASDMAKQAAAYLTQVRDTKGEEAMMSELEKLKEVEPELHAVVSQMVLNKGSQRDPKSATENPNPTDQASPGNTVV